MHGVLSLICVFNYDLSGESCIKMEVWECDTIDLVCSTEDIGLEIYAVGPTLNVSLGCREGRVPAYLKLGRRDCSRSII